jgi:hypothetical protein
MDLATRGFQLSLDFLMDVIPAKSLRPETDWNESLVARMKYSENRADLVYKLAEVHLSLIYDYLYTKFRGGLLGVLHRPASFVLTSISLSLFLLVLVHQKGAPTRPTMQRILPYHIYCLPAPLHWRSLPSSQPHRLAGATWTTAQGPSILEGPQGMSPSFMDILTSCFQEVEEAAHIHGAASSDGGLVTVLILLTFHPYAVPPPAPSFDYWSF